jgi:hypothetical protein
LADDETRGRDIWLPVLRTWLSNDDTSNSAFVVDLAEARAAGPMSSPDLARLLNTLATKGR